MNKRSGVRRIYKYGLNPGINIISLPAGAELLCAQAQRGEPQLWALVDPNATAAPRTFEVFATGEDINADMGTERRYVGTFQLHGGSHVFHVFESTGV